MKNQIVLFLLSVLGVFSFAQAKTFPLAARLFLGVTNVSPKDMNDELTALGLKTIDNTSVIGIEAMQPINKELSWGLRFSKKYDKKEESPDNTLTNFDATLNQDVILILARYAFLNKGAVRMDTFIGLGGSNTSLRLRTLTQSGELSKKEANDWVASPAAAAGLSIGVGHKGFYVVFEGGYEYNKVTSLKRDATLNNNINEIDLSGSYGKLALMFDGLQGSSGK